MQKYSEYAICMLIKRKNNKLDLNKRKSAAVVFVSSSQKAVALNVEQNVPGMFAQRVN